jgi:hypothetical protein
MDLARRSHDAFEGRRAGSIERTRKVAQSSKHEVLRFAQDDNLVFHLEGNSAQLSATLC